MVNQQVEVAERNVTNFATCLQAYTKVLAVQIIVVLKALKIKRGKINERGRINLFALATKENLVEEIPNEEKDIIPAKKKVSIFITSSLAIHRYLLQKQRLYVLQEIYLVVIINLGQKEEVSQTKVNIVNVHNKDKNGKSPFNII